MFEIIIETAKRYVVDGNFKGKQFTINNKEYFVDIDSDNTLFITHEINGEWEVLIDDIIIGG